MPVQKITGPDDTEMTGFVIVDIAAAGSADGIVRCAKKILMDGARTMARSRTYAWALLGVPRSGASAAINVAPAHRQRGVEAFVEAVTSRVAAGELSLDAGKGVAAEELDTLAALDRRSNLRAQPRATGVLGDELAALSAVTAAATALDGLEGRTVAIEGAATSGPLNQAVLARVAAAGAIVVAVGTPTGTLADPAGLDPLAIGASWREHGDSLPAAHNSELPPEHVLGTSADVLFCGSRLGLVDHEVAASLATKVLAPTGVAPVTAKGLAVASRAGVVVLADFLTMSGALHSFVAGDGDTADHLAQKVEGQSAEAASNALSHADGAYLGACAASEAFLAEWVDELPFGRPLA